MSTAVQLAPEIRESRADWLTLVVRHGRRLAAITLVSAVVLAIVALLLPPTYLATTRLMPPQQSPSLASLLLGQANQTMAAVAQKDLGLKNPADLYIGLLNSRSIQDGIIEQFDLVRVYGRTRLSDVRAELARRTRIQQTKEGLIAVGVEDRDARRAADLANAYAEQLRKTTRRLAISEAGQRRQFFDEQVEDTRAELERAETALTSVQQKTGMLEMDAHAKVLIESGAHLRAEIAASEVKLRTLRGAGTEQNPDVRQQEAQLGGLRAELARLESQGGDVAFSKGRAPEQVQAYARALRDVKYAETLLEMLLRQREAARLDESREATVIQVVDTAVVPDTRIAPRLSLIVLFGTALVLLLAISALILRERWEHEPGWQIRWIKLRAEWRE